ncbi:hypothetical protein [Microcystis aeruginosa]|uniref:hypothetical protein n=2 Tax=Microcystis TaxID=1125 RepID=UPI001D132AD2|nr:hypothetical protein [Microcystis aeruginosa]
MSLVILCYNRSLSKVKKQSITMNSKTEITIQVPLEIARYYAKINPNDRANLENKITATIQLELEKYRQKAGARLSTIMDQASDEAEANGLTPDILASILEQDE